MTTRQPLTPEEVARFTAASASWTQDGDALVATWRFADFRAALAFMVLVGLDAEAMDHHPEMSNTYNRVTLRLSTHDAGNRVTALDVALAGRIEAAAARLRA